MVPLRLTLKTGLEEADEVPKTALQGANRPKDAGNIYGERQTITNCSSLSIRDCHPVPKVL